MQEKLLNRCGYGEEEHTHNRKVMKNVLGKTWHHHSSRISSARLSLLESTAGLTQILGGKCSCNRRIFREARTPSDIHPRLKIYSLEKNRTFKTVWDSLFSTFFKPYFFD